MAKEPAPVAPLMTTTKIDHQSNLDRAIRSNKCTFLLRTRLLAPLLHILITNALGVYSVPTVFDFNDLQRLAALLTDEVKADCQGGGLRWVAQEPHAHYTYVFVQVDGSGNNVVAPWRAMLQRCEVEETAVLSFYEDGMPIFIFRHDGYDLGEVLPILTDMNVVDPEPVQDDQT